MRVGHLKNIKKYKYISHVHDQMTNYIVFLIKGKNRVFFQKICLYPSLEMTVMLVIWSCEYLSYII